MSVMSTNDTPLPGSPGAPAGLLLRGLLDDASLFPPGNLPMPEAVEAHRRHASAWYAGLTGPFVCPETRLAELRAVLTAAGLPEIDLSLVVTGGAAAVGAALDEIDADRRLRLRAIEVPLARGEDPAKAIADVTLALDAAPVTGVTGYIEIPVTAIADPAGSGALLAIADERGYRPKLRTGGTTALAFPGEPTLAACLIALARRWIPFKCTAGLHHAVRHTALDTGFEHHGFLNVLLGVAAAASGAATEDVTAVLAERDPHIVTRQIRALDHGSATAVRSLFASFGTCSTDEPVADLVALGLLSQPGATIAAGGSR